MWCLVDVRATVILDGGRWYLATVWRDPRGRFLAVDPLGRAWVRPRTGGWWFVRDAEGSR